MKTHLTINVYIMYNYMIYFENIIVYIYSDINKEIARAVQGAPEQSAGQRGVGRRGRRPPHKTI